MSVVGLVVHEGRDAAVAAAARAGGLVGSRRMSPAWI